LTFLFLALMFRAEGNKMSIHQYLGKIGRLLPTLTEWEWNNVFQFIDYFNSVEYKDERMSIPEINWKKLKEVLELLEKIK